MKLCEYIGETTAYDKKVMLERGNPIIADLFHHLDLMERRGSGFGKILDAYKTASTRLGREFIPSFHSDATDFVVTLPNLQYGMRDVQDATKVVQSGAKLVAKTTHKTTQKTTHKILLAIANNPNVIQKELSVMIGITPDGIKKAMEGLKKAGLIGRVGGKKGGHWEVVGS